jgi:uncharacterized protein
MTIDKGLLEILACPKCKGEVEERAEGIVCRACRLCYPVEDGIPVMLAGDAAEWKE